MNLFGATTPCPRRRFRSGGHSQRREHFPAGVCAFRASVRADAAMFVFFRMAAAFGGTGAAESDAGGELSFQRLPISCLICARDHAAGGGAHRRAIQIEADAGDQRFNMLFGKACVGAGGACLDAKRTSIDTCADGIRMGRMLGMRAEHGADDGHAAVPFFVAPRNGWGTIGGRVGSAKSVSSAGSITPRQNRISMA